MQIQPKKVLPGPGYGEIFRLMPVSSSPTEPFFGDTADLHTAISVDAGTMNRLGQEEAFRFARGEEVTFPGRAWRSSSRPLDWLVISDHGLV